VVAGLGGGTIGAWVGVLVYCLAILPSVHDPVIFTACVLVGFLLGAVSLGFLLGGPPDPTRALKPVSVAFGGVLGGVVGILLGIASAYLSIVPGSAAGTESMGYFVLPVLGGIAGLVFGLAVVVTSRASSGA
jgi:hypothetical protein